MKTNRRIRIHLSLAGPLVAAIEAIAKLEGCTPSDIVDRIMREGLVKMGALKPPTPEEIEAAIAAAEKAKPSLKSVPRAPGAHGGGKSATRASTTHERDRKNA